MFLKTNSGVSNVQPGAGKEGADNLFSNGLILLPTHLICDAKAFPFYSLPVTSMEKPSSTSVCRAIRFLT